MRRTIAGLSNVGEQEQQAIAWVYLPDEPAVITRKLLAAHSPGKLFRMKSGKAWTLWALNNMFMRIQILIGKGQLAAQGLSIPDDEIKEFMASLAPTRQIRGQTVKKTKRNSYLEARRKLINRLACSLAPRWSLYAIRHTTWATNALQRGVDPLTTAILTGHGDPSTLSKFTSIWHWIWSTCWARRSVRCPKEIRHQPNSPGRANRYDASEVERLAVFSAGRHPRFVR